MVVAVSEANVREALDKFVQFLQFPETNKDIFTILELADAAFRELTGLGLKEAKDLVDKCPNPVKEGISKDEALSVKAKLEEVGAQIDIK